MQYGYTNHVLGSVTLDLSWILSGPSFKSAPLRATSTRAVTKSLWEGSAFNGAVGVKGQLKNTCPSKSFGVTGYNSTQTFNCVIYDNASYDHEQVVEVSWFDSAHAGRWWTYVKSPVEHSSDKQHIFPGPMLAYRVTLGQLVTIRRADRTPTSRILAR